MTDGVVGELASIAADWPREDDSFSLPDPTFNGKFFAVWSGSEEPLPTDRDAASYRAHLLLERLVRCLLDAPDHLEFRHPQDDVAADLVLWLTRIIVFPLFQMKPGSLLGESEFDWEFSALEENGISMAVLRLTGWTLWLVERKQLVNDRWRSFYSEPAAYSGVACYRAWLLLNQQDLEAASTEASKSLEKLETIEAMAIHLAASPDKRLEEEAAIERLEWLIAEWHRNLEEGIELWLDPTEMLNIVWGTVLECDAKDYVIDVLMLAQESAANIERRWSEAASTGFLTETMLKARVSEVLSELEWHVEDVYYKVEPFYLVVWGYLVALGTTSGQEPPASHFDFLTAKPLSLHLARGGDDVRSRAASADEEEYEGEVAPSAHIRGHLSNALSGGLDRPVPHIDSRGMTPVVLAEAVLARARDVFHGLDTSTGESEAALVDLYEFSTAAKMLYPQLVGQVDPERDATFQRALTSGYAALLATNEIIAGMCSESRSTMSELLNHLSLFERRRPVDAAWTEPRKSVPDSLSVARDWIQERLPDRVLQELSLKEMFPIEKGMESFVEARFLDKRQQHGRATLERASAAGAWRNAVEELLRSRFVRRMNLFTKRVDDVENTILRVWPHDGGPPEPYSGRWSLGQFENMCRQILSNSKLVLVAKKLDPKALELVSRIHELLFATRDLLNAGAHARTSLSTEDMERVRDSLLEADGFVLILVGTKES